MFSHRGPREHRDIKISKMIPAESMEEDYKVI